MLKFYPDIQENDPRRFGSGSYCNGEVKKKDSAHRAKSTEGGNSED